MKKIGIIIPHYNSVHSTIKLLDSIYIEKSKEINIETVVVDDRSTENINDLQNKISSLKSVKLLINDTPKKGAGVCRNIGLSNIDSDWTIFADADDYFEEGFVQKIMNYVESDSDIIYFNCISREEISNEISNRHIFLNEILGKYSTNPTERNEHFLKYNWIVPWGKMIKTSIIKKNKIKFDEIMVANDVMFSIRLGKYLEKITASSDILYCVVKSKGTLTTSLSDENYRIRSQVMIDKHNFLKKNLPKSKLKYLPGHFGRWLIDGYLIYKLDMKTIIAYYFSFKKSGLSFFPPISSFKKINRVFKDTKNEKRYSKF